MTEAQNRLLSRNNIKVLWLVRLTVLIVDTASLENVYETMNRNEKKKKIADFKWPPNFRRHLTRRTVRRNPSKSRSFISIRTAFHRKPSHTHTSACIGLFFTIRERFRFGGMKKNLITPGSHAVGRVLLEKISRVGKSTVFNWNIQSDRIGSR